MLGDAAFTNEGAVLNIQTGDQTVLHWKDFSIGKGELTRFIQPNEGSAILNRVVGGEISKIYGQLHANGKVYLINPHGVLVGEEGIIDTSAFLATTLDCLDQDLLGGGDVIFQGGLSGQIVNLGLIRAQDGDVFLIAHQVTNQGVIEATNGVAGLGAGYEVLLQPKGHVKLFIRPAEHEGVSIDQRGEISALSAEIKANGNPYEFAIRQSGKVNAKGVERREGRIFLVAEKGQVEQSGQLIARNSDETGGEVRVLGEGVWLSGGKIDVSGASGGKALIGGDFQGDNREIYNSQVTQVDQGVEILASAQTSGDGGRVIVWSDQFTHFEGKISANGGTDKGNGGFVEISGANLTFRGAVAASAPRGKTGTLLLDPIDVTISGAATDPFITPAPPFPPCPGCPINFSFAATSPANILSTDLEDALACCNVTVDATQAGPGSGDILVDTDVIWSSGNSLTLLGGRDVMFMANVRDDANGGLFVTAARDVLVGFTSTVSIALQDVAIGSMNGPVNVTATTGAVNVGYMDSVFHSQIGYDQPAMSVSSSISVIAETGIQVLSGMDGGGPGNSYAQIGHGGENGGIPVGILGDISASPISLSVTGVGNIRVANVGQIGEDNYAQIGHGGIGVTVDGTITGDIDLTLSAGDLLVAAGVNSGGYCYAQVGHGGNLAVISPVSPAPAIVGDISAIFLGSGNVSVTGGQNSGGGGSSGQIGHGGISFIHGGDLNGNIILTLPSGDVILEPGPAFGAGNSNFAQIGHGGVAAGNNSIAPNDYGGWIGDISVTLSNGSIIIFPNYLVNSTDQFGYSQIGHGGVASVPDFISGNISLNAAGTAPNGNIEINVSTTAAYNSYSQIGHGGSEIAPGLRATVMTGTISGNIDVTASESITLFAGGDAGQPNTYAQIGHIGAEATLAFGTGDATGNINVTALNGSLTLRGGTGDQGCPAQIGHGGFGGTGTVIGTISGDINVNVPRGAITLIGGSLSVPIAGAQNNIADIGHWFFNTAGSPGTIIGNTTITSGGTLRLDAGPSDNNGAYIESMGGTLSINVNGGDLLMTGGSTVGSLNCAAEINSLDTQTITVAAGGLTLTQGAGDFAIARISVLTNNQTITVRDYITLQGDATGMVAMDTGATIDNLFVGTNLQTVISTQGAILISTDLGSNLNAPSAAISSMGSDQIVQANTEIVISNNNSGTSGACRSKIGGNAQSVTVTNGNISVIGGGSPSCISEIGSSTSQFINVPQGSISVTGGAGTTSFAQITSINGSQTVSCSGNLTLQGGPGPGTSALARILHLVSGVQSVSVGGDLQLFGGTATGNSAVILSAGPQFLTVGGNALLQGGTGTSTLASFQAVNLPMIPGTQTIVIGQNLTMQAGTGMTSNATIVNIAAQSITLGGNLHAIGGPGPTVALAFIRTTAGNDTIITSTGGDVVFRNGTPQTNGAFLQSAVTPPVFTGAGVSITAAGNIALANDLTTSRAIAFNANSNGNGQGAFLVDTRSYPSFGGVPGAPLNGITLRTTTGDITIRAASRYSSGSPADFLISLETDLSYLPLQPCQIMTTSGNILIDPFRNVIINTAVTTLGDITILADNDITLTSIASLSAENTTLVVDEQGQNGMIGGIWDPLGGDFILNDGATIIGTSTLRIFTAVRLNNTIDGAAALNGVMFVPGQIYVDTGTEQWLTYFGGPRNSFIGPNYIVFYKDFPASLVLPLITPAIAQLFEMCDPYSNFLEWSLNFTIKSLLDFPMDEPYSINRRINAEQHNPKTDRVKKWDE